MQRRHAEYIAYYAEPGEVALGTWGKGRRERFSLEGDPHEIIVAIARACYEAGKSGQGLELVKEVESLCWDQQGNLSIVY